MIDNKITNRITKVLKNSQQNNSETVTNEDDRETPNGRCVSPEERQKIIDELRLKLHNNEISKNQKIIQRKLQMRMIKKYLKQDIYFQKEDKKILIIWDQLYSMMMEYQKIIKFLDNTPNQPTKFRTKNWAEINDDSCKTHNTNSQIKFNTSMFRSSLYDYSDAYIPVSGKMYLKLVFHLLTA